MGTDISIATVLANPNLAFIKYWGNKEMFTSSWEHTIKVFCQPERSLTVARPTVPGQGTRRRQRGEVGIKLSRVFRTILGVLLRMVGKMVFEVNGFALV